MDHYFEIKVLSDVEFLDSTLMNAVYTKLHRALALIGQGEIGVSFPLVRLRLGNIIRLHGTKSALERLISENWLKGLSDYTQVSPVTSIPREVKYRVVKRVQAKSGVNRMRRRSVLKGWMTEDEAIKRIPLSSEKRLKQPFIQLSSKSTGQTFRLFIEHCPLVTEPVSGNFSAYGLSNNATVPWF